MCFSAQASFAASAGLAVVGAVCFSRSKTTPQHILACIPLIFSVQQLSEGLLWLSLSQPAYAHWQRTAMYVFLVFAEVVWPAFVPLTILLFENDLRRKKVLRVLSGIGIFIAIYMSYCMAVYPVSASIEEHHINYQLDFPLGNRWFSGIPYLLAAVLSPFVSGVKFLRLLGWGFLVAYLVTRIWYAHYLISVWCFFAAILSLMVLYIINRLRKGE
ncbi:MAG: hypothetical protein K0R82_2850 [Flavipsychrobacter sp.]|jgi:hypothetical protein|nr:hypothetical protein [Flavipsychrobacter sp.]